MSAVPSSPEMAEVWTTRLAVPPPSPRLCTQRIELLKMTLNLSTLTDEQKYNDVIQSVRNWENMDIMSYIEIIHDRFYGPMPSSDEETPAPDAGEGPRNKKRLASANDACVSCVFGSHVNIYVKA